jgi:nicotinate-nucleotide adenylyltransferase
MFIPSFISPHKQDAQLTAAEDRLAMLREALRSNPFFEVSDMEINRGGVSFTVDTLRSLRGTHPAENLFLMIGRDNLAEFHAWKDPSGILEEARLIVMSRPGARAQAPVIPLPADVLYCDVPAIDISSTDIRRRVAKGLPVSYLVPPAVARYIEKRRLYRPVSSTESAGDRERQA